MTSLDMESDGSANAESSAPARTGAARRRLRAGNLSLLLTLLMLFATLATAMPAPAAADSSQGVTAALQGASGSSVFLTITATTTPPTGAWVALFDQNGNPINGTNGSNLQFVSGTASSAHGATLNFSVNVPSGQVVTGLARAIEVASYHAGVLLDVYLNVGTPPPIVLPPTGGTGGNGSNGAVSGNGLPIPTTAPGSVPGTISTLTVTAPDGTVETVANIAVTTTAIQQAVTNTPAGQSYVVIQVPQKGSNQVTEVALPSGVIAAATLAGKGLSVSAPQGTVTLNPAAMNQIEQSLASGQQAVVYVKPVPATVQQQSQTGAQNQDLSGAGTPVDLGVQLQNGFGQTTGTFEPSNGNEQIQLTLPYNTSSVSGTDALKLGVYYWDPASSQWTYEGGKVDLASGTVTVSVNHLSVYQVLEDNQTFADLALVPWASTDLGILIAHHIVTGVTSTAFEPNAPITRAEFAALIDRALGLTVPTSVSSTGFTDVATGDWFAGDVVAAAQDGILKGYPDGSFHPNAPISRQELAVMIDNAMTAAGQPASITPQQAASALAPFSDASSVAQWAQTAMGVAVSQQIVNGRSATVLDPGGQATRAEASVMLKRLMVYLGLL